MQVNAKDYWPQYFENGLGLTKFMYVAADGSQPPFTSIFGHDAATNSMTLNQFDAANKWQNTWFLHVGNQGLVEEWRDDTPLSGLPALIFGGKRTVQMEPPIGWGGDAQEIGRVYANIPEIQGLQSTPPELDQNGFQAVAFEALLSSFETAHGSYTDVLQILYQQTWKKVTAGARFWMAKGIGPIALQWAAPDLANPGAFVLSARMDAIVSHA